MNAIKQALQNQDENLKRTRALAAKSDNPRKQIQNSQLDHDGQPMVDADVVKEIDEEIVEVKSDLQKL